MNHLKVIYQLWLLLFLGACSVEGPTLPVSEVRYFSSILLRESPYPYPQGIVPLTQKEALSRKHYRFMYNPKQQLIEVSFWHKNTRVDPNHTANYFMQTSIQRMSYFDDQQIVTYFDRFENPVTLGEGVIRDVYSLDEFGKRVHLHFEDVNGHKVENRWNISDYEWAVQLDGSVIEDRYDLKGQPQNLRTGFPFNRIRLCYEPNGMLALMQNIDSTGKLINNETGVAQDRLTFDALGRWYGWTVLDADNNLKEGNGPGVAKGVNIPDKYGYETKLHYEDRLGQSIKGRYGFYVGRRSYDEFGNYDATWFEDSQGNLKVNELHGYAYADYTWDTSGINLLSIAFYDAQKRPVMRKGGYHKMVRSYNPDGLLGKIAFYGTEDEKVNRSDNGAHYYEYKYHSNNALQERRRFDKEDREILENQ